MNLPALPPIIIRLASQLGATLSFVPNPAAEELKSAGKRVTLGFVTLRYAGVDLAKLDLCEPFLQFPATYFAITGPLNASGVPHGSNRYMAHVGALAVRVTAGEALRLIRTHNFVMGRPALAPCAAMADETTTFSPMEPLSFDLNDLSSASVRVIPNTNAQAEYQSGRFVVFATVEVLIDHGEMVLASYTLTDPLFNVSPIQQIDGPMNEAGLPFDHHMYTAHLGELRFRINSNEALRLTAAGFDADDFSEDSDHSAGN